MLDALPIWYALVVAFLFGTLVGSFLNVVIARVPTGMSVVKPRSRCPGCERPIAGYDNVPIVSWLLLRGQCRRCGIRISPRYPFVELAVGLLAVAAVRQFGPSWWAVAAFGFLAVLVALTYIDLDHWLLPRSITIPFIAIGLGVSLIPGAPGIASSAMGAAAGFAAFVVLGFLAEKILKKEALGGGDVWLLAMIGAWLGVESLLPVVLLASLQGAVIGGFLLIAARRRQQATAMAPPKPTGDADLDDWVPPEGAVPFGPFLALGAAEYLFFGERLVDWYLGLLAGG
ncbi:prepilin peptidase [Vulgatibacter sp.]|uniref:prepilin peptidase n=1 Tax=Vulgatibacter sp. TaxID=1971226 RepID=UPI00356AEF60